MRELLVLLFIIAVIAIIWYLRKQSAQDAERRKVDEFRRLQAAANEAERAERASLTATAPILVDESRPATRGGGLFEEAAETAAGARYERAAEEMDEMTAELAQASQEAEREAAQLSGRAGEAMAAVQAAAAAHGGAVPGDGTRDCPASYPIKGNMPSMLYHEPGQPTYQRTIPEVCFENVAAAESAGFSSAREVSGLAGAAGMLEETFSEEVVVVAGDEERARVGVVADAVAAADAGGVPPGAIRGDGSRDCPSAYPIKGNQSSLLYHEPGTATYERTIPEFCFSSADSAVAAGFSPARR
ncbi:MAG: hypothetical protein ACRDJC_15650 [Thermomicrobiales bacterium]